MVCIFLPSLPYRFLRSTGNETCGAWVGRSTRTSSTSHQKGVAGGWVLQDALQGLDRGGMILMVYYTHAHTPTTIPSEVTGKSDKKGSLAISLATGASHRCRHFIVRVQDTCSRDSAGDRRSILLLCIGDLPHQLTTCLLHAIAKGYYYPIILEGAYRYAYHVA